MMKSLTIMPLLLALILLSSCSMFTSNDPEPVLLSLTIAAGDNINPSALSKANPVVIRIYQLSALDAFKSAQVLDLYQQDTKLLADSLIQKQNIKSILPDEQRQLSLTIQAGTKYLAVFAQFSDYSQAKTKAWVDISKLDDIENLSLTIESLTVNIQPVLKESFWSW